VLGGILNGFGLFRRVGRKKAEIFRAVEIEFEGRRVGLEETTITFYPSDNNAKDEWGCFTRVRHIL
jgi:hypothetical protein